MADNWILDVLADLGKFARKNNLTALAAQLDETSEVARAELMAASGTLAGDACRDGRFIGAHIREHAAR